MATHSNSSIEKLNSMIKGIKIAMMTTRDEQGNLHSRPMATQEMESDGNLWFFTYHNAPKVGELKKDQEVNLSYMVPDKHHYVSISGNAELVRDKEKMQELWNPLYRTWFPQGLDDPNIALLKVKVKRAEYWDAPSSTMVHLFGVVKAMATGKPYEPGQHEKINLAQSPK